MPERGNEKKEMIIQAEYHIPKEIPDTISDEMKLRYINDKYIRAMGKMIAEHFPLQYYDPGEQFPLLEPRYERYLFVISNDERIKLKNHIQSLEAIASMAFENDSEAIALMIKEKTRLLKNLLEFTQ